MLPQFSKQVQEVNEEKTSPYIWCIIFGDMALQEPVVIDKNK